MMPHPQYIETPGGEQMVILPRKEYEQLCEAAEDADDVRAYDEAKRRLAAGEDEMVPGEFADRILDGENPVRVWREYRGLSVKELAEKAEISAAYLSQIEGGAREGSVSTMKALATALNLDLDDLV
ncbi:MAG: helix-turn-helix domain-containing protein [Sphingomonadales bacterium]